MMKAKKLTKISMTLGLTAMLFACGESTTSSNSSTIGNPEVSADLKKISKMASTPPLDLNSVSDVNDNLNFDEEALSQLDEKGCLQLPAQEESIEVGEEGKEGWSVTKQKFTANSEGLSQVCIDMNTGEITLNTVANLSTIYIDKSGRGESSQMSEMKLENNVLYAEINASGSIQNELSQSWKMEGDISMNLLGDADLDLKGDFLVTSYFLNTKYSCAFEFNYQTIEEDISKGCLLKSNGDDVGTLTFDSEGNPSVVDNQGNPIEL